VAVAKARAAFMLVVLETGAKELLAGSYSSVLARA
jgi:hypothetical protein